MCTGVSSGHDSSTSATRPGNSAAASRWAAVARSIDGEVSGSDPSSDLAVVHIDPASAPRNAKPLQFADSRQVRVGDTAIAIGNPFGLDRTVTAGIVSSVDRQVEVVHRHDDAVVSDGDAGSSGSERSDHQ